MTIFAPKRDSPLMASSGGGGGGSGGGGGRRQNKAEERHLRAAHRRNRRAKGSGAGASAAAGGEDEEPWGDFESLRKQLETMSLTLREVQGDGNCLFRALCDQLSGSSDRHISLRREVVKYMRDHRLDFEPFLVDETSFERHLELLERDGTFGGNDSIVAFARLYKVTVVIHQLNEPLWQLHGVQDPAASAAGGSSSTSSSNRPVPEIHISYHNGDHYNSVRRIGEERNARRPADIKITGWKNPSDLARGKSQGETGGSYSNYRNGRDKSGGRRGGGCSDDDELSDYENATKEELLIQRVMKLTGIQDEDLAREALEDNAFCLEAAVDHLFQMTSLGFTEGPPVSQINSIWHPGGTGNRIFGEEASRETASKSHRPEPTSSGNSSYSSSNSGSGQRSTSIQQKLQQSGSKMSSKKRQGLKKQEKRLANDERKRRNGNGGRDEEDDRNDDEEERQSQAIVVENLKAVSI